MTARTLSNKRVRRKDAKAKPARYCERCSASIKPRTFKRGEECLSSFMLRRFCSLKCSSTRGKRGKSRTQRMVQARAIALRRSCECCGGSKKLAIHHVDENWNNNTKANLQTLCIHCHQQWHGLHKRLGIRCSTRMPRLIDMPVSTYHKIEWRGYDPRKGLSR